ncbi:metalloproteinase inhibitor 2-like isoform X1 [Vanacampus margaritifer]
MIWKMFVLPLVLLCLWGLQEERAQACSCFPMHPQQLYCQTDVVVIRAKVVGVMPGAQGKGQPTKYDIQHLTVRYFLHNCIFMCVGPDSFVFVFRTFKGVKKLFAAIYTGPNSAACGVTLTKGTEYLLIGKLQSDGTLHLSQCDFHELWDSTQKNRLSRYAQGCGCTIKSCFSFPCCMTGPSECLWTDFLPGKMGVGEQAQNFACIKSSNGCCTWYRAAAESEKANSE